MTTEWWCGRRALALPLMATALWIAAPVQAERRPPLSATAPSFVQYATYLGGSADESSGSPGAIAVDAAGNAYVTGSTESTDFPLASPMQAVNRGDKDVFVTKLDATGFPLWSTYLGGVGSDDGRGIAVDPSGNVIVVGMTLSPDFPLVNAFQSTKLDSVSVGFVTKLDPTGSRILFSTFLGGNGGTAANAVAVDASGAVFVAGSTFSTDFPVVRAFQRTYGSARNPRTCSDAFLIRFDSTGLPVSFSTYLGGFDTDVAHAVAIDPSGRVIVVGYTTSQDFPVMAPLRPALGGTADAFVAAFSPDGSKLDFSTWLGGTGSSNGLEWARGVAAGADGVVVAGITNSSDFPLLAPLQPTYGGGMTDAFVVKLDIAGAKLLSSTFLGGSDFDDAFSVALDSAGHVVVAGHTASPNFPVVAPVQAALAGAVDAFVAQFDLGARVTLFSTYLGGSQPEWYAAVAVDPRDYIVVAGVTRSADFPTVRPFQPALSGVGDAFIARLGCEDERPEDLGNSLLLVRSGADALATWTGSSIARSYALYRGLAKGAWPPAPALTPAVPLATLRDVPSPPDLLFYRVAGMSCSGREGP